MRTLTHLLTLLLFVTTLADTAVAAPADDARKHLVRGMAAIEAAKSEEELADAAEEFRTATEIAPEMPAAWYNLGAVQAKQAKHKEAIASYQRYLQLAPNAEDAPRIRDEITKLEYLLEKATKFQSRSGLWVDDQGAFYRLGTEGNRMVLSGMRPRSRADYDFNDYMIVNWGGLGGLGVEKLTISLAQQGSKLTGTWEIPAGKVWPSDACTLPAEKGEVEGKLDEKSGRMVLKLLRNRYKVVQVEPPIFGNRYCQEVTVLETRPVELAFTGPLPHAGIGYTSLHESGNFFVITQVDPGSEEAKAGLKEDDRIVAIDGVAVQQLPSIPAKWQKFFGPAGSPITLQIRRPGGLFADEEMKTIQTRRNSYK